MRVFLLLVCGGLVGIALGVNARDLNTYAYLPDELNAPCGKTVFEWNVLAARLDATPIPVYKNFDLVRLEGEPKPQGLIVRAYIRSKTPSAIPAPNTMAWNNLVSGVGSETYRVMRQRLSVPSTAQRRAFMESDARLLEKCYLLVHLGDRLIEVRNSGRCVAVAPDATREEQLAALAKIMSQEPAP